MTATAQDEARYLIVGLGIAGTVLAWRFIEQGVPFHVIDAGDPHAASRVAPGIINPLAGRRLKPSWRVGEQLPEAMRVYAAIGDAIGAVCFRPLPIIRVIKDREQLAYFEQRRADPIASAYIGEESGPGSLGPRVRDPLGSFIARGSGYLDSARMVAGMRDWLAGRGLLSDGSVDADDIVCDDRSDSVTVAGTRYRGVVFCEGHRGAANRFFSTVPFNLAKGEMLELRGDTRELPDAILNRGKWILPVGPGRLRAGATYSWDPLDSIPTESARAEILALLRQFIDVEFEVVGQSAGVRPIVGDYRPALGRHPQHPALIYFNGLGSKGVLSAPWLAKLLTAHLLHHEPLPPEVQVQRFFRPSARCAAPTAPSNPRHL